MKFCVHAEALGTPRHLLYCCKTEDFQWISAIPTDVWAFGTDHPRSLDLRIAADILNIKVRQLECPKQTKAFAELGVKNNAVPWYYLLSKEEFGRKLKVLLQDLCSVLESLQGSGYMHTFIDARRLLLSLSSASIDEKRRLGYMKEELHGNVKKSLHSFQPTSGFSSKTIYAQSETVTGRLTVKEGPRILTLPRQYRNIIKSRHTGGHILYVDLVSLEPRTALYVSGQEAPPDIYKALSAELFHNQLPREAVKTAVLCALYGAGQHRLSDIIGSNHQLSAKSIIDKVKLHFDIQSLSRRLRAESKSGYIKNWFGRKLTVPEDVQHKLISYYVQSTAVDVALLVFSKLLQNLNLASSGVCSLFIIHDAIIIDVPDSNLKAVKKQIADGVHIDGLGHFPLSIETVL